MKSDVLDSIKRLNRVMKRQSLSVNPNSHGRGQGRVLRIIMDNEGIIAKDLARLLDIRPPSLTEKLDKLELDGNIIRIRDRRDMRVVRIFITEKGREAVARRAKEKDIVNRDFSDCLSDEEKELFCSLCERMSDNMEEIVREEKAMRDNLIILELKNKREADQKSSGS